MGFVAKIGLSYKSRLGAKNALNSECWDENWGGLGAKWYQGLKAGCVLKMGLGAKSGLRAKNWIKG